MMRTRFNALACSVCLYPCKVRNLYTIQLCSTISQLKIKMNLQKRVFCEKSRFPKLFVLSMFDSLSHILIDRGGSGSSLLVV